MNDHSRLLILGGVVGVLAPFVLIGIGIASDYRAGRTNRPYVPHHARNIVLSFAVVIAASVVFARLSHHSQAPTLAPVRADGATGVPFAPAPTPAAAAPHVASPGASVATSPRSTTTTVAGPGSGLLTAFLSALVKGTTVATAPTGPPPGIVAVSTTKPPTTTATTGGPRRARLPRRPRHGQRRRDQRRRQPDRGRRPPLRRRRRPCLQRRRRPRRCR